MLSQQKVKRTNGNWEIWSTEDKPQNLKKSSISMDMIDSCHNKALNCQYLTNTSVIVAQQHSDHFLLVKTSLN